LAKCTGYEASHYAQKLKTLKMSRRTRYLVLEARRLNTTNTTKGLDITRTHFILFALFYPSIHVCKVLPVRATC